MRPTDRLSIVLALAVSLGLAGPPGTVRHGSGGGEFYSRGPISGAAPIGASGSAPTRASGSFLPSRTGFRNGFVGAGSGYRGGDDRRHRPPIFYLTPFAYPYLGYDNGYGYGSEGDYSANAPADRATQDVLASQDQLGQQVQQLSAEINDLKSQQQQQASPYTPQPMAPSAAPEQDGQSAVPLTLVLQSGQQVQVKDYAVMDGVFWDFSKQPARKIPVSSINLNASVKATQDKGGDFPDLSK